MKSIGSEIRDIAKVGKNCSTVHTVLRTKDVYTTVAIHWQGSTVSDVEQRSADNY